MQKRKGTVEWKGDMLSLLPSLPFILACCGVCVVFVHRSIQLASAAKATDLVEEFMAKVVNVVQEMSENINILTLQVS